MAMKKDDSRRGIGIFGSVPVFALPEINSVNELKALVGISSYQGSNENAYPSLEQIAKRIGLSLAATSTAISGLFKKRLVGRKRNYGRNNTYYLLVETQSIDEMKEINKAEKRKIRAERLKKNLEIHNEKNQSFESLEYTKVSNVSPSKVSNVDYSKSSNDIYNTNIQEQNKIPEKYSTLKGRLEVFAITNNLVYDSDIVEDQKAQSKFVSQFGKTNEQIWEQAEKLIPILKDSKSDWWAKQNAFGFKFLRSNWSRIDAWHAANKPKNNVVKFERTEKEKPTFDSTDFEKMKGIL